MQMMQAGPVLHWHVKMMHVQALMLRTMVLSCLLDMIQACLDIARCEYQ